LSIQSDIKKWSYRFFGGFLIWLGAILFGLIALKGNVDGIFTNEWWFHVGAVYGLWGFLNFLIFFGLVHFIIPWGMRTKHYLYMILLTYALILAFGLVKYACANTARFNYVLVSYRKDDEAHTPVSFTLLQYMIKTLFTGTFVAVLSYGWGLTSNWFKGERFRKELENGKMAAELSFLRMQINPHFLFNSLNSIYSLSLKKSDAAPQAVLKLSEMMRYMLYEHEDTEHKVSLAKEIEYLKNYVALQKIRFDEQLHVEFLVEGEAKDKKIAPLLLVPFVENGFKHGLLSDPQYPFRINLLIDGNRLVFQVRNKKNLDNKDQAGGIGMTNVNKRLMLLYPGKHQLTVRDEESFYQCDLTLYL